MNFPPYVPEVIRKLYKETLEDKRFAPELAKRLEQYIFSPNMRDAYGWFSNIVKSDHDWIIFFGVGMQLEEITNTEIEKEREQRSELKQLLGDARKIKKKIEKMEQAILSLKEEQEFIRNEIKKYSEGIDTQVSDWFEYYDDPNVLSKVVGREKNLKTESIRYVVTVLYQTGFELDNPNLKKAIAIMARILFDIDDDITYDDVRKVIDTMDVISPGPY